MDVGLGVLATVPLATMLVFFAPTPAAVTIAPTVMCKQVSLTLFSLLRMNMLKNRRMAEEDSEHESPGEDASEEEVSSSCFFIESEPVNFFYQHFFTCTYTHMLTNFHTCTSQV